MSVLISDDILQSAQISEMELKRDVAILLLRQEKLSLNKARELADMPMAEFQQELIKRGLDSLLGSIEQSDNIDKQSERYPLRSLPLQIGADFDEPMTELRDELVE
jgi:predicted HTH domain antitoxin